ncbi:MAG: putative toxin-antitoxin system toxin component, PIN family [Verrucomicrobiota bacterium]
MKVVFDTNVVASASFWRGSPLDCLCAWAKGRCEAVVSPALPAEYQETILELKLQYPARLFVPWTDLLTESAILVFPSDRATGATTDPDDEMILECAQAAEAEYIVSGDKKHLLALRRFRGIPIVSPADFLRRLPAGRPM